MIYVTHRLNEVFRISHRVTVLRDGVNAGSFATKETDMKQLVGAIVGPGHALSQVARQKSVGRIANPPSRRAKPGAPRSEPILTLVQG